MSITINGTTGIAGVDGSATTPAFQGNDTNTGIFYPAADTIAFAEGGTEVMRIDSSGNVGIGTTTMDGVLNVYSASAGYKIIGNNLTDGNWSEIGSWAGATNQVKAQLFAQESGASSYVKIGSRSNHYCAFTTNDTERMRITSGGEVYIAGTTDRGAFNLQCNGTGVWGAGAYTNGSDARIKDDITPITNSLETVKKLNPVTFKYKEDWSKDQSVQTGFIAQELLTALEGQVYVDGIVNQDAEYMSVAYQNIIPLLTKAIQELSAKVDAQQQEINALKEANNV